ncbi:hypothetical protein ACIG54_22220 [Streptomyces achromogenes]|jgi:hypothetical protein|uniref:hypothetical protein n=1 Tax=Streptomyces achromogenes TaxID=67255 RepID=UPI003421E767
MNIDNQFVKAWRNTHNCKVVSHRKAQQLFDYLNTLPWGVSRIDWSKTPGIQIPFGDDDPQPRWVGHFSDTPLGRHEFIMVAYAPGRDALVAARDDVLADLDILYAGAPGVRYFCGADIDQETVTAAVEDFAEFSDSGVIVHRREQG